MAAAPLGTYCGKNRGLAALAKRDARILRQISAPGGPPKSGARPAIQDDRFASATRIPNPMSLAIIVAERRLAEEG
jgi:hypothetical protein